MLLHKEFTFEAAHYLPSYHGKCEKMHGHTYRFLVTLAGSPDAEGMIIDFTVVKKIVAEKVLSRLDHVLLNEIIPNPSTENICLWLWQELQTKLPQLTEIRVWETANSSVSVQKKDWEEWRNNHA